MRYSEIKESLRNIDEYALGDVFSCRKLQVESGKLDAKSTKFTLSPISKRYGAHLVNVNVAAIDAAWKRDPDFYIGPNGAGEIKGRYARFGDFLQSTDQAIEASEMEINSMGQVFFDNGRHRFAYLRDHGMTVIPVALTDESLENAKRFGYLA